MPDVQAILLVFVLRGCGFLNMPAKLYSNIRLKGTYIKKVTGFERQRGPARSRTLRLSCEGLGNLVSRRESCNILTFIELIS